MVEAAGREGNVPGAAVTAAALFVVQGAWAAKKGAWSRRPTAQNAQRLATTRNS